MAAPIPAPKVILHQFPQSHFCIRLRWALALKGIAFEVRNYRLTELDQIAQLTGGYRRVPVLQWNEHIVCDSPVIARFIEKQVPSPTIYPGSASAALCDVVNGWADSRVMLTAAKWQVKAYLEYLGNDEDRAIYRRVFRNNHGIDADEAIARHEALTTELLAHWGLIEENLADHPYLLGEALSYADLGVASRLRLMQMAVKYELPAQFPRAREWFRGIAALAP